MLRARLALGAFGLALGIAFVTAMFSLVGDGWRRPDYVIVEPAGAGTYFRADADLGYAPAPGVRVRSSRGHAGEPIYDVLYTIDEHGLRVTPGSGERGPAVVFFGGSFTFGEGVEDDESLPASLASWLRDDTQILNAGFHGYGPHQMLRSLELDLLGPQLPEGVEQVVYQGLDGHVMRVAGRTTWDVAGPQYELQNGVVSYVGPFRSVVWSTIAKALNRFGPARTLLQWWLRADAAQQERDRQLYVEVVARAAELVRERWGARFTVLYWDHDGDPLADRLRERGLDVLRVSDALDGRSWRRFVLPVDRHPSRWGYQTLAGALTRNIRRARRTVARRTAVSPASPRVLEAGVRGADGGGGR